MEGNMDLSTRVNYLNSLLDQGSITEEEYQQRTEPIRVASEIIKFVPSLQSYASLQLLLPLMTNSESLQFSTPGQTSTSQQSHLL